LYTVHCGESRLQTCNIVKRGKHQKTPSVSMFQIRALAFDFVTEVCQLRRTLRLTNNV